MVTPMRTNLLLLTLVVHSQADDPQVTPAGIEMQTFSVTKQVEILCFYLFMSRSSLCIHIP